MNPVMTTRDHLVAWLDEEGYASAAHEIRSGAPVAAIQYVLQHRPAPQDGTALALHALIRGLLAGAVSLLGEEGPR